MTPALTQQLIAAAPLLLMALGTVVLMGLIATHRNHRIAAQLTTLGFLLTIGACLVPQASVPPRAGLCARRSCPSVCSTCC